MKTHKQWKDRYGWVTVPDKRVWDPPNLRAWVDRAVILYPQIIKILLIGSRGGEQGARPDSDHDIVILLDSKCYQEDGDGYFMSPLEQALTFDDRLVCHGLDVLASGEHDLDVYFLRPNGRAASWNFPVGKTVPMLWYFDLANNRLDLARKEMWEKGLVHWSNCRPFYQSLPNAPTLFNRQGHTLDHIRKRLLREPLKAPGKLRF